MGDVKLLFTIFLSWTRTFRYTYSLSQLATLSFCYNLPCYKFIMELVKVTTPEYLSDDIFDEDFLKTFLMLHRLQYVMGCCRLDAKNRFVTPPTAAQKCYTILCILMTAVSNIALGNYFFIKVKHPMIRYLGLSSIIIQFTSYVSNTIHVRFFNSDKNVEFYVKMQKIDRLLKVDRWTLLNNRMRKVTNIPVAFTLLIFIVLMIIAIIEEGFICLYFIGPAYSLLVILMELTACSSIICYFVLRIRFINTLMENHLTSKIYPEPSKRFMSLACINYYTQKSLHYYETCDTNIYLRELFKCFTMYQDLYRFQVITLHLWFYDNHILDLTILIL